MLSRITRFGAFGSLAIALLFSSLEGSTYSSAQASGTPEQGKDYLLLEEAQAKPATAVVTVTEMFGYFCPHCFHLEPALVAWAKSSKPAYVKFDVMPIIWPGQEATVQLARLYYTVVALHREDDLHDAIFNEIHVARHALTDEDGRKAEQLQAQFLAQHGVSTTEFAKLYHSPEVNAGIEHARARALADRVLSVPTLIINEKYTTDLQMTGEPSALLAVVDQLAAREHKTDR
jgi:thiol:disulfide interchange protein DsbA